ncbi:MAG: indolepyruvate ferredoxin oxidoreductase subunit alpha, partial [Parvularculaceae bacterium]|nr:indolepyruvate ferredoxin oxidoreductase subunit alpha [Parvularculaceae bacterium]
VDEEVIDFCKDKSSVLVIEEGQPNYIEQALAEIFVRNGVKARLHGKDVLPEYGEYKVEQIKQGMSQFLDQRQEKPQRMTLIDRRGASGEGKAAALPARPPGLCTGCPERPLLSSILLLQNEVGKIHVNSDIGCHSFSVLPPFNLGNTILGYGLSAASASALQDKSGSRKSITIMGDGGFWHNGLTTGVASAAFNDNDNIFVIVDNGYSAATGGQDIPSSADNLAVEKGRNVSIEKAVQSVGVKHVKKVHTYNIPHVLDTIRLAMLSKETGPKVIIAEGECMLNRQRREKPKMLRKIDEGKRVIKSRFYVDERTCTGDHACIRLSGCPSLTVRENPSPLRDDPVAYVNNSCVGCGVCGEVAHAAVLCPSFSRVDLINNPSRWDRWIGRLRQAVVSYLQDRRMRAAERA